MRSGSICRSLVLLCACVVLLSDAGLLRDFRLVEQNGILEFEVDRDVVTAFLSGLIERRLDIVVDDLTNTTRNKGGQGERDLNRNHNRAQQLPFVSACFPDIHFDLVRCDKSETVEMGGERSCGLLARQMRSDGDILEHRRRASAVELQLLLRNERLLDLLILDARRPILAHHVHLEERLVERLSGCAIRQLGNVVHALKKEQEQQARVRSRAEPATEHATPVCCAWLVRPCALSSLLCSLQCPAPPS